MAHLHHNMTSQQGVISKNIIFPNFAIMGNVTRSHDKIVVTNNLAKEDNKLHGKVTENFTQITVEYRFFS